jgi:hypothetical protein
MAVVDFPNMDVSGGTGEVYPEGIYKVKIDKYEMKKASTGTEQVRWYGRIAEGPYKGKTVLDHCALSDKALWKIGSFIHHAGFNLKKLPKLNTNSESFKRVLQSCVGREMYWYLIVDTYNGKDNNKTSDYKRLEQYEGMDGDEVELEDIPEFLKQ